MAEIAQPPQTTAASTFTGSASAIASGGAVIQPDYTSRTMKFYPVCEPDIRSLGQSETFLTVFAAAATFFAGTAVSIWLAVLAIPEPEPPIVVLLRQFVLPGVLVIAAVFLALAGVSFFTRKSTLDTIRKESKSIEVKTI